MKRTAFLVSLLLACVMLVPQVALASLDEAKAMVEKAAAYYQANGKEKTLATLNTPDNEFVKGSIYVFAYDNAGTVIAHPVNKKLVGTNTVDVPDVDGKLWRKEALEKVGKDGTAVVDYKYKNPTTNKVEQKTTYFKKVGDVILGCGTYK